METLINNLGLEEEVLQRGSDKPAVSMREVAKVRPELLTKDPSLLRHFPEGGKGSENMDEGQYLTTMMQALGAEYADDEAMQGMTGDQRIQQLMRKHPKQLDNFFNEVGRRLDGRAGEQMQNLRTTVRKYTDNSSFDVSYYQNRKSRDESREEYRERTKDGVAEKKSQERQNLINNAPFGL